MFHADDWPIDQANHFLNDSLDPNLEHRQLLGYSVDHCVSCGHVVEIRLMEHKRVVMEAEKMARIGGFFNTEESVPVAGRSGCIGVDPFEDGAGGELALLWSAMRTSFSAEGFAYIVVDVCGPARVDLHTSVAIAGNGAHQRPHFIYLREELALHNQIQLSFIPCSSKLVSYYRQRHSRFQQLPKHEWHRHYEDP